MISLGAIKLGMAIYSRLSKEEDRNEVILNLTKAVGDSHKVSIIEWSTLGKRLGVFDTR